MKTRHVLLLLLTGATLLLSACGHRGYWGGHGHSHNSGHSHYADCGHRGYCEICHELRTGLDR